MNSRLKKQFPQLALVRLLTSAAKPRSLKGYSLVGQFVLQLDLLTSRAFERVARQRTRNAIVPSGPTTPDQKTKRTTLRKSIFQSVRAHRSTYTKSASVNDLFRLSVQGAQNNDSGHLTD